MNPAPRWPAALVAAFYAIHAAELTRRGFGVHALWMCHLSNLLIALGWATRRGGPIAVGMLWLVLGTPLWILNMIIGAEGSFVWTSTLTHLGGLAAGWLGVRRFGWPRGSWGAAAAALGLLYLGSRGVPGAVADNVNFAGRILAGWEGAFGTYPAFLGVVVGVVLPLFWGLEWGAGRWCGSASGQAPPGDEDRAQADGDHAGMAG